MSERNCSDYVLERRRNPELRNDEDRRKLAKAQAKRARKAEAKRNAQ